MFRDAPAQDLSNGHDGQLWPVLNRERRAPRVDAPAADAPVADAPAADTPVADTAPIFRAAQAAPDVPAAVGKLLFGTYLALIGALAVATAGPGESGFMLVIAALFVVAFFTVPRLILAQEPKGEGRTTMDRFLAKGLDTYTGHCSGRAALVQMFVVPALLTFGILLIALVIAWVG